MSDIPRGAIRFNTDSNKPELWDGSQWAEFQLSTPNLAQTGDPTPGARGLFMVEEYEFFQYDLTEIDYINLASAGDAIDFGDITALEVEVPVGHQGQEELKWVDLESPGRTNVIDIWTIASNLMQLTLVTWEQCKIYNRSVKCCSRSNWWWCNTNNNIHNAVCNFLHQQEIVDFGALTSSRSQTMGLQHHQ